MIVKFDLHTHTYYSDGLFSPAELIEAANEKGLRAIAITDHDNTRGSREAVPLAAAAGIELIPAIEITTSWVKAGLPADEIDIDLLGYFLNLEEPAFRSYEESLLADSYARIEDCCVRVSKAGFPLSLEDIFAENPRYAGPVELIRALARKGIAPDKKEAQRMFDRLWLAGQPGRFSIQSAIEAVHRAGGVAVLAHPIIARPGGQILNPETLRPLVDAGLDGLEVFHHRHDQAAREYFTRLAHHFDLLITGGSDFHARANELDRLGAEPVIEEMLERLREKAG